MGPPAPFMACPNWGTARAVLGLLRLAPGYLPAGSLYSACRCCGAGGTLPWTTNYYRGLQSFEHEGSSSDAGGYTLQHSFRGLSILSYLQYSANGYLIPRLVVFDYEQHAMGLPLLWAVPLPSNDSQCRSYPILADSKVSTRMGSYSG